MESMPTTIKCSLKGWKPQEIEKSRDKSAWEGIRALFRKKTKKCLTNPAIPSIITTAVESVDAKFHNGLSPNGKATDSDSVIVKVRILLAQLNPELLANSKSRVFCVSELKSV